jgi:hypothetical protein
MSKPLAILFSRLLELFETNLTLQHSAASLPPPASHLHLRRGSQSRHRSPSRQSPSPDTSRLTTGSPTSLYDTSDEQGPRLQEKREEEISDRDCDCDYDILMAVDADRNYGDEIGGSESGDDRENGDYGAEVGKVQQHHIVSASPLVDALKGHKANNLSERLLVFGLDCGFDSDDEESCDGRRSLHFLLFSEFVDEQQLKGSVSLSLPLLFLPLFESHSWLTFPPRLLSAAALLLFLSLSLDGGFPSSLCRRLHSSRYRRLLVVSFAFHSTAPLISKSQRSGLRQRREMSKGTRKRQSRHIDESSRPLDL